MNLLSLEKDYIIKNIDCLFLNIYFQNFWNPQITIEILNRNFEPVIYYTANN